MKYKQTNKNGLMQVLASGLRLEWLNAGVGAWAEVRMGNSSTSTA